MLRMFVRVSGVLGLAALALVTAASALAGSATRSGAAQPIEAGSQPQAASIAPNFTVGLSAVVPSGLTWPVGMANAGDGKGRLFVVEQPGYIRVVKNGVLLSTPYLALTGKVSCCGERGASVADPSHERRYLLRLLAAMATTITRYVTADPASDVANIAATPILTVAHPMRIIMALSV
jgi:glucose/arabinose dehydrogenase